MFMPARFLLENHHATSFDDLRAGLAHLQRKAGAHKEGQLSFLKVKSYIKLEILKSVIYVYFYLG